MHVRAEGKAHEPGGEDLQGAVLLRCCPDRRHRRSGGRRLLPLRLLQELVSGPVNAFTLWKPEAVKVTQGEDPIGEYNANERSYRQWCTVCGGHLLTRHPLWGLVDVYAATIPSFPFTPGVHVNTSRPCCR